MAAVEVRHPDVAGIDECQVVLGQRRLGEQQGRVGLEGQGNRGQHEAEKCKAGGHDASWEQKLVLGAGAQV